MTSRAWRGWEQVQGDPPCPGWGAGLGAGTAARSRAGGVTLTQPLSSSPDITVICPWEAFSHLELHELAQYGII